jgi:halimadienyl-diphosphate synthase
MDLNAEIKKLLEEIGPGRMSSTAYDTAWVARLVDYDREMSNNALSWLCENQLPDGSWGAAEPFYYHDRVISTLAAMIALTHRGRRAQDKAQIEKGLLALERITSGATSGLAADPNGATVGFEMIVPTLVAEAERLGIIRQQGNRILGRLRRLRDAKMAKLQGLKINRYITPAFSAEMAGDDQLGLLDIENLQENNGSVANSPAATAHFAMFVKPSNLQALDYLKTLRNLDGGIPFAAPFDIFERAWVLWNLLLGGNSFQKDFSSDIERHLQFLQSAWCPESGVGFSTSYTPCDGDDTSLTFEVLSRLGVSPDIGPVQKYENETHYICYPLEINASISVNAHVLGALKQAGYDSRHPSVKKVLNYLRTNQYPDGYWVDKWHISPFYPTAHIIINCADWDKAMCEKAMDWMLKMQQSTGAWGYFGIPTAEETAYCLQALEVWRRRGNKVPVAHLISGAQWLERNYTESLHQLWIGKVLYCPENVVHSAMVNALSMVEESERL